MPPETDQTGPNRTKWIEKWTFCKLSGAGGRGVRPFQRKSNMHRLEVHHFASPFAPYFLVEENSGFIQEILQKQVGLPA